MESVSNVHNNNRVNHRINHQNTTFVRTTTVAGATRGSRNNSGTIPRQEATPRPAVLALIACMSLHFFIFTWVSLNSTGLAQHYHRHRPQSNDVTRPRSKSRTDILTQPNALPRDCCCLGERRHQQQTRLPPSTYMNLQGASHMVCTRICGQQQDRRSGKESSHDHLRRQQAFCRCLCLCLSVEVFVHRRD